MNDKSVKKVKKEQRNKTLRKLLLGLLGVVLSLMIWICIEIL